MLLFIYICTVDTSSLSLALSAELVAYALVDTRLFAWQCLPPVLVYLPLYPAGWASGLVWFGLVWFRLVWSGLVWLGPDVVSLLLASSIAPAIGG